jgi:predicted DNA-binding transcriptional regulator YafY
LEQSISIWFEEGVEPYKIKLLVSSQISQYFKRKPLSNTQTIESIHPDGSLEISVKITNDREILSIIKYWLPHIKILEPARIKDQLKLELENYINEI